MNTKAQSMNSNNSNTPGPRMPSLLSVYRSELAIAAACVALLVGVGIFVPAALSSGNFSNILQASAPLVIMSLGVLVVIITGGIDLSVGSIFSLTGMVTALTMASGFDDVTASLAGLSVGIVFGAINGFLITLVGLAPFVVTLITYAVAASLAFIVTNGRSLGVNSPDYWLLNSGEMIPGLPNFVLFCLIFTVLLEFVLRKVTAGRWFYSIGSSPMAAYLLGIPVKRTRFAAYVISGTMASFAGLLTVSYILNAEATAGASLMLQAIAAVVIGGASLSGGTGSAIGAVLGALMITIIQNGVNLIGINSFWQGSVTGLAILVAVLIDRFSHK